MKKIIPTLLVLLLATSVSAKTLYVNNTGSPACSDATTHTNNDSDNPWCSLGRATWGSTNRISPSAGEAAAAGDTVIVEAGTYTTSGLTNWDNDDRWEVVYSPANSGTNGNEITFQANGTVILETEAWDSNTSTGRPVIGTNNRSYIIWDGFTLVGADNDSHPDVGMVTATNSSDNITFKNLTLAGVLEAWGSNDNYDGIRIEASSNITIHNNTISNFRYDPGEDEEPNKAGIKFYSTSGTVTVTNNTISNCGTGIFVKDSNSGSFNIRKNLIHTGGWGFYIMDSSGGAEITQNVIRDVYAGIRMQSVTAGYGPTDTDFVNNTVDNATVQGGMYFRGLANASGNRFHNNIITNSAYSLNAEELVDAGIADAITEFEHNHYYSNTNQAVTSYTNRNWTYWTTTLSKDTEVGNGRAGEVSDPGYVDESGNDFTLSSGANAEDGGVDILDLDGDLLTTDAINRGAYITGNEVIGASAVVDTPTGSSGITVIGVTIQ